MTTFQMRTKSRPTGRRLFLNPNADTDPGAPVHAHMGLEHVPHDYRGHFVPHSCAGCVERDNFYSLFQLTPAAVLFDIPEIPGSTQITHVEPHECSYYETTVSLWKHHGWLTDQTGAPVATWVLIENMTNDEECFDLDRATVTTVEKDAIEAFRRVLFEAADCDCDPKTWPGWI